MHELRVEREHVGELQSEQSEQLRLLLRGELERPVVRDGVGIPRQLRIVLVQFRLGVLSIVSKGSGGRQ